MAYSGPYPLPIVGGGTAQTTSPSFSAYLNAPVANVTGDNTIYTIVCNAEMYDTTNSYDTGTGLFTVPVTGNYLFNASVSITGLGAANTLGYFTFIDGSANVYRLASLNMGAARDTSNELILTGAICVNLAATQTMSVAIAVFNGGLAVGVNGSALTSLLTSFSGYLLK